MQLLGTTVRIHEYALSEKNFQVFNLVKNAKKRRGGPI